VNRGLSPPLKGFSQLPVHGGGAMFTLRALPVSHSKTADGGHCNIVVTDVAMLLRGAKP
jgi:hypothetical protein